MIIEFRCEREYARRWMNRETLSIDGRDVPVQIAWVPTAEPRPAGLDALFELERVVLHKGKASGADHIIQRWRRRTAAPRALLNARVPKRGGVSWRRRREAMLCRGSISRVDAELLRSIRSCSVYAGADTKLVPQKGASPRSMGFHSCLALP